VTTPGFFNVLYIVSNFFLFSLPHTRYLFSFLCTFVVAHCVFRVSFFLQQPPHSYDFDGHGTSRNDRISYSYNKT